MLKLPSTTSNILQGKRTDLVNQESEEETSYTENPRKEIDTYNQKLRIYSPRTSVSHAHLPPRPGLEYHYDFTGS